MVIYIEKVIILNVFIHLLLVVTTLYITNNKTKKRRVFLSTLLGVINMIIYLLHPNLYNIQIKYLIVFLISYISFFNIKSTLLYFMLNFLLGGITGVVSLSIRYYYEVIFLCSIFILLFIYYLKGQSNKEVEVIIKANKEYCLKAFYDTGCLINVGLTPVIVLSNKIDIELEYFTTINISTIAGDKYHDVYKAKSIYICTNNKKVLKHALIIKSDIDYDLIIGKNFIGGL